MERRSDQEIYISTFNDVAVGGGYYSPAEECLHRGRKLTANATLEQLSTSNAGSTFVLESAWKDLSDQIRDDEYLIGIYRRRLFREEVLQAVQLPDVQRLGDFEFQVVSGAIDRIGFVAATEDLLKSLSY